MRSLLDVTDLSTDELEELCNTALDVAEHPERYSDKCRGNKTEL